MGIEYSLPLVDTGVSTTCTTVSHGQWLILFGLMLQLLGWAFATLFVAGFTNAVRKT